MFKVFTALSASLRGSRRDAAAPDGVATRVPSGIGGTASRKQMLAVVLRETLLRNNVPNGSVGLEFFRTIDRTGARTDGIHVRLIVRDGHPDLPSCMLALERDFRRRVALIDYRATEWLQGVTWQFELPEEATAPGLAPAAGRPAPQRSAVPASTRSQGATYAFTEPAPL